jgi:hypothetical protein
MLRAPAATTLFVALAAATVCADDREDQFVAQIEKLTPQVETVATGGRWFRGSIGGTFRLVIRLLGFEFQRNHAFLQWVRLGDDATDPDIVERTVPLAEISGGLVTTHRFVRVGKDWKLIVGTEWLDHASDPPKKQHKFYIITPAADYTYTCRESTRQPDI